MGVHNGDESEDDEDILKGVNEGFRKHIDALKRACVLEIGEGGYFASDPAIVSGDGRFDDLTDDLDDDEDEEELLQSIQSKYGYLTHDDSWFRKGPSYQDKKDFSDDDEEDDEEILRSVEDLYSRKWDSKVSPAKGNVGDANNTPTQLKDLQCSSTRADTSPFSYTEWGAPLNSYDSSPEKESEPAKELGTAVSSFLPGNWIESDQDPEFEAGESPVALTVVSYHDGNPALSSTKAKKSSVQDRLKILADTLKKNRQCQRTLKTVQSQIEEKQKVNVELQKRVRSLVDFEKHCSRRFAGIFCDHANPSVQLITTRSSGAQSKSTEAISKMSSAIQTLGPPENPDVKLYKELQPKMSFNALSRRWSNEERRNLARGVKQRVCQQRLEVTMFGDDSTLDLDCLDEEMTKIRSQELTSQDIRDALPRIDWAEVARLYVVGRTPEECRHRWINHEDPLINKSPWTKTEDKMLLSIAEKHELCNWENIATRLGTNRTPAECLIRYQRSLNVGILRRNWSSEEDDRLRAAVEELGERNWSAVSACLEGRNNNQCLMRWYKVLHPSKKRKGRWSVEEDKRLKLAVSVHGAKKWKQIAEHVPGRTDIQCRERWCNVLDPGIKLGEWTEEEDRILEESVAKHGPHHWAAIASDIKIRTDNQCCRRWKYLHPENQLEFQRTVHIRQTALIGNFQGRKKERSRLCPQDFISKVSEAVLGIEKSSGKRKSKARLIAIQEQGALPESASTSAENARLTISKTF